MQNRVKDMLGVYLIALYMLGAGLAMILFGFGANLTAVQIIVSFALLIAIGVVAMWIVAQKIMRGCGE